MDITYEEGKYKYSLQVGFFNCIAQSDQGEVGLGLQLGLEMAPGSSALSPRSWTMVVLAPLISLGPKQISSFSLHK